MVHGYSGGSRRAVSAEVRPLVKVDMGEGRIVAVEARNFSPEQPVGIADVLKFDGVTKSIEAVADRMTAAFDRVKPDRASVEFGIDIGVESGTLTGLVVKGTGNATLTVTLEWQRTRADGNG
jgi:Trypsin-co-occurring domain 1